MKKTHEQHPVSMCSNPFFEPKEAHWMASLPESAVTEILRQRYGQFYEAQGKIDYQKLKSGLRALHDKALNMAARNLFLSLFSNTWRLNPFKSFMQEEAFLRLSQCYGRRIMAHGVEEAKGGLLNIAMVCISGVVQVPSFYWGHLIQGASSCSPVPHGPYFLVSKINGSFGRSVCNDLSFHEVEYILLPAHEVVLSLQNLLYTLCDIGIMTPQKLHAACAKMVTYDELYQICQKNGLMVHGKDTLFGAQPKKEVAPSGDPSTTQKNAQQLPVGRSQNLFS